MKLSTKGRYAMVALADIALQPDGTLVTLGDIAQRQDISLPYLEQLFVKLRRAGLVTSVRGPGDRPCQSAPFTGKDAGGQIVNVHARGSVLVSSDLIIIKLLDKRCNTEDAYLHGRGFLIEEPNLLQAITLDVSRVNFVADNLESLFVRFRVYGGDGIHTGTH